MEFPGFLGNDQLKASLSAAVDRQRAAHFYLLSGPSGAGKRTLARLLAAALLCRDPHRRPCGRCGPCRKVLAGTHPDFITVDDPDRKTVSVETVRRAVDTGLPTLGICLGMQMMLENSEEAPGVEGIGIFKGAVRQFPKDRGEKVPHMGWNQLTYSGGNPFLAGVPSGSHVYFVHSYYADPVDRAAVAAECDYIVRFAAALGKGNVFAAQFHPEKSQKYGMTILKNFVTMCNNGEQ